MHRTLTASLFAVAGLALAPCATTAQTPTEINFGIISTEASINQKKYWEPFVADMSKATGLKINAFYATDYAGVIEAMRFNKVQVAWYGNKSAIEAVDRSNGEVFAQTVAKDGSEGYYSHVIVNADGPLKTLDDVLKCDKSLNFGIGDPNSTSGFLVPTSYVFAARGIDPKACFKTVRNANHEANALSVVNKQVDAASVSSEALDRLGQTSPEGRAKIRIVWTSPLIPQDPIVWRRDLDPAVKEKLVTFLLSYGRIGSDAEVKTAREVLLGLLWAPMKPSSNDQLLPIRKLEANKTILKVQADEKISAEEKAKQIEALKAKIAAIEAEEQKAPTSEKAKIAAAFKAAEKEGNADNLKRLIGDIAASYAKTN